MNRDYTPQELQTLHTTLYEILAEIVRVCNLLDIPYFIQGGTAIGAFFEEAILPWDDDIDIGMTRANYDRFVREAPAVIDPRYFVQWVGSDPVTPFYFVKVRKHDTLFVEADFEHLAMHQGIFIDVFPFDKVPDTQWLQKLHRKWCQFLNCCFMGKSIWLWRHCGTCQIAHPTNRGFVACLLNRVVDTLFTKRTIYRTLSASQGAFNHGSHTYYNMVLMPRDHIAVATIEHPQQVKLGPLTVTAPSDLETYLRHHYPRLRRYIPKEEQQNHRPKILSFNTQKTESHE